MQSYTSPVTYVFIDATNIIYGTKTRDGNRWKVDFQKLYLYLKHHYQARQIFYFAGLDQYNTKQRRFYQNLRIFGYTTVLKPVKLYHQSNGDVIRKANCDVDLTFYVMKTITEYQRAIILSGDGDFLIVLKYLLSNNYSVKVIANGKNTAKEIKQLVGADFTDINRLREKLQ